MFDRDLAGDVRSYLSSKRSRLARALEALRTRRRGRNSVALTVGDGNNRVVERRVNVGDALGHNLADLLTAAGGSVLRIASHGLPSYFLSVTPTLRGPLRVRALVRVR